MPISLGDTCSYNFLFGFIINYSFYLAKACSTIDLNLSLCLSIKSFSKLESDVPQHEDEDDEEAFITF
jgi:hypothetical protein